MKNKKSKWNNQKLQYKAIALIPTDLKVFSMEGFLIYNFYQIQIRVRFIKVNE
jgi:hypothetical protein